MGKTELIKYANEIVSILDNRKLENTDISKDIDEMLKGTKSYIGKSNYIKGEASDKECKIRVLNAGTLEVMEEQINNYGSSCGMDFASAKYPGGGFLSGARAQEESLCYNSLLYGSLKSKMKEVYEYSRNNLNDGLYSTWCIYSPNVLIVRNKDISIKDKTLKGSFVTSPAPNKGIYKGKTSDVRKALEERCRLVLDVCIEHNEKNIVLGAFGCGVFKNSPLEVATIWYNLLYREGYSRYFDYVDFAILDKKECTNYKAFMSIFSRKLA